MILTHAKDITKAYGGLPVRDAVLVVPSFYTQPEKQALVDAADIADVRVSASAGQCCASVSPYSSCLLAHPH